jgi:hypothetical protein
MKFESILFKTGDMGLRTEPIEMPAFFVDLNLDQIINTITAAKQEYDLSPFFYTSLRDLDSVMYRHEIMKDLENKFLSGHIKSFSEKMRTMREHLKQAEKLHHKYQKESWFLDAVEIYCEAVCSLTEDLTHVDMNSHGKNNTIGCSLRLCDLYR